MGTMIRNDRACPRCGADIPGRGRFCSSACGLRDRADRRDPPGLVRSLSRVAIDEKTGCWVGRPHRSSHGYVLYACRGKSYALHRVIYELNVGSIPAGLELDHLCRNRACCNPDHLEAVTHQINVLRGESVCSRRARQTHCIKGHTLSPDNLVPQRLPDRVCLTCKRIAARRMSKRTVAVGRMRRFVARLSGDEAGALFALLHQGGTRLDPRAITAWRATMP